MEGSSEEKVKMRSECGNEGERRGVVYAWLWNNGLERSYTELMMNEVESLESFAQLTEDKTNGGIGKRE